MTFERAMEIVQERGLALLTSQAGLVAVGVGAKGGGPLVGAGDFAVTASVPRKLSKAELKKADVPRFEQVFAKAVSAELVDESDIEVVESGGVFAAQPGFTVPVALRGVYGGNPPVLDVQKHFQSLRTGIGIANPVGDYPDLLSVGTLGFCIRDGKGAAYLVSNNHVIARVNAGIPGDAIIQPGSLDLTSGELAAMSTEAALVRQFQVAKLDGFVKLKFPTAANTPHNLVDLAWAKLSIPATRGDRELHRLCYGGSIAGVAPPIQVDAVSGRLTGPVEVFKVGRTTGYTEGVITQIGVRTVVNYGGKSAFFVDQIEVAATSENVGPFSKPGDSGSGVLDGSNRLVGLLFAGTDEKTLINPISNVMTELEMELRNVTVVTG